MLTAKETHALVDATIYVHAAGREHRVLLESARNKLRTIAGVMRHHRGALVLLTEAQTRALLQALGNTLDDPDAMQSIFPHWRQAATVRVARERLIGAVFGRRPRARRRP